jgi:hypothetical protein
MLGTKRRVNPAVNLVIKIPFSLSSFTSNGETVVKNNLVEKTGND